jgi:hypothetical protein
MPASPSRIPTDNPSTGSPAALPSPGFDFLPGEDPVEYAALHEAYTVRHAPICAAERFWVDRAVAAAWRLRHLEAIEARCFAAALAPTEGEARQLPSLATLARYRARIVRDIEAAMAELDRLVATRPRRPAGLAKASATRLRWLADRLESGAVPDGTDEPESMDNLAPSLNRAERRQHTALGRHAPPSPC